jgi:uncharacterized Tic20 family protein
METPPYTYSGAPPKGSDKVWTILCHLSILIGVPFLLPLIVYLAMKSDSEYVAANAREALNFHISVLIYAICCVPLVFILIGIPLLWLIGLLTLIFAIIAAVKATEGGCYRYPLTLRLV